VRTPDDAVEILKASGADGVMVGRGSFGRPWIVAQMQAALEGKPIPADPAQADKWRTALDQYRASLAHYGPSLGRRVVRKHLGWYAEGAGGKSLRDALVRAENPEPILERLAEGRFAEAA
jgi:tRNA-dihydrouridine synthase B